MSEFTRMIDLRGIGDAPLQLEASEGECAALAKRFGLVAVRRLAAEVRLLQDGAKIDAEGRLTADVIQSCAVSGEDLPVVIVEPLHLRFVPAAAAGTTDEEIELDAEELDEIGYAGSAFDLGEALAQSLALAIDPFAIGPEADRVRQAAGLGDETAQGPFAALAALKRKAD
jgi:uncharacterized metal-binding protein YceD (DUF177 family)